MATKKKLLQAAAGTAAASGGAGGLNVEQVFSTYLYEGNGSSQAIVNGINLGDGDQGSVGFDGAGDYLSIPNDTSLNIGSGSFTVELWFYLNSVTNSVFINNYQDSANGYAIRVDSNVVKANLTGDGYDITGTTTVQANTWYHVALSGSSGSVKLFLNGTQEGSTFTGSLSMDTTADTEIGALFYSSVLYPTNGYISNVRIVKGTALYTSNFTPPTSILTAITNTTLLTCQGNGIVDSSNNSHTITANGDATVSTSDPFTSTSAGEGGLVWVKSRSSVDGHIWIDTERGVNNYISSGLTAGQNNLTLVSSFNSNGYTVSGTSTAANSNGYEYTSWTFRKAPKFFDVVTYTGDGVSGRSISHDLGTTVGCIIVKRTDASAAWSIYHRGMDATAPQDYALEFNTDARTGTANRWADTAPTSTTFTVGSDGEVNASGGTYVAYLFAHNDGDGDFGPNGDADIIKCGSYTGDGTTNGTNEVTLGWEPQWILTKRSDSADNWHICDVMRGQTTDGITQRLRANTSAAESANYGAVPTSTGFKLYSDNSSGGTYIYIAIRRGPMAVPESATDVFAPLAHGADTSGLLVSGGFTTDAVVTTRRDTGNNWILSRLTGGQAMYTNGTASESDYSIYMGFDQQEGIQWTNWYGSATQGFDWQWKRAPNYFDVVAYSGNGTAGRTVSHNLGVAPEMMWVKRRNLTEDFFVYHGDLGASYNLRLNKNLAANNQGTFPWNATAPTDSVFTVYNDAATNGSGSDYIAYLFASVDGVSKVGSFTMAGSDINVDCGFSSGARFVLLKRTDSTGNWLVFDSERGIVAGADPYLLLNTTDAEDVFGALDIIDPYSSGFTAVSANIANGDWIFYAIA